MPTAIRAKEERKKADPATLVPALRGRTLKYSQLAEQLRTQIESGLRRPGEKLPTFAQMQAEHGLGQATLERVYQLLEDERLIVREPGKGVFVAEPQQRDTVGVLGVATCAISEQHPYYAHLLQGVRDVVREVGWELLLTHDKATIKWEKVDGVLLCCAYPETILRRLPPGMPRISLLHAVDDAPCVVTSDHDAVQQAVQYLLELGHRRIGYLTLGSLRGKDTVQRQRLLGYNETLKKAGIIPQPNWIQPLRDPFEPMQKWETLGRQKIERWLQNGWIEAGCTGILAHNDETAIGVIEALQAHGLRVPEDVSVIGFDGTEIATYFRPRLTTVEVPLQAIGARGARLLLDQIAQPVDEKITINQKTIIPAQLVVGHSTAPTGGRNGNGQQSI